MTKVELAKDPIASMIFAHGAGADMDSVFIEEMTSAFVALNINVIRFNFPYMEQRKLDGKRRPPNKMDVLVDTFQQQINNYDLDVPLFIGGKSMGSRVAAMLANDEKVAGVFCFGYPFHPQKKPEKLRLEPLQQAHKPVIIAQGSRDALGDENDIQGYNLDSNIQIHFLDDGDHDLKPRVKSGFTHREHKQLAINHVSQFIKDIINNVK